MTTSMSSEAFWIFFRKIDENESWIKEREKKRKNINQQKSRNLPQH